MPCILCGTAALAAPPQCLRMGAWGMHGPKTARAHVKGAWARTNGEAESSQKQFRCMGEAEPSQKHGNAWAMSAHLHTLQCVQGLHERT